MHLAHDAVQGCAQKSHVVWYLVGVCYLSDARFQRMDVLVHRWWVLTMQATL